MRIGLIDVDGSNFPNLAIMKISAYHKAKGDDVEWYEPLIGGIYDRVYMSKVFTFTEDYQYHINAAEIVKGGTGYFYPNGGDPLPPEIEHIYPDYELYGLENLAIGFMTRGCPRGCEFCIVAEKEGRRSIKVADLSEFWRGQKRIELMDPNTLACSEWHDVLSQLIESRARVNFNQGLDIRMMTQEKAEMLANIKLAGIHFAFDRIEDRKIIVPKFEEFRKISKIHPHDLQVYVLCGDRERRVLDSDLWRIYWLRDHGFAPYVMLYDKNDLTTRHELRRLQRWVNNRRVFWSVSTFEEYQREGWRYEKNNFSDNLRFDNDRMRMQIHARTDQHR